MKYYKVLARADKKLFSINRIMGKSNPTVTRYIRNTWVKPKFNNSKLFAFSDVNVATEFAQLHHGVLYEAEVKNPVISRRDASIVSSWEDRYKTYADFWLRKKVGSLSSMLAPRGTVFCDAVKITKRVKN